MHSFSWPHQISDLSIAVTFTVTCRFLDALFFYSEDVFATDIIHFFRIIKSLMCIICFHDTFMILAGHLIHNDNTGTDELF